MSDDNWKAELVERTLEARCEDGFLKFRCMGIGFNVPQDQFRAFPEMVGRHLLEKFEELVISAIETKKKQIDLIEASSSLGDAEEMIVNGFTSDMKKKGLDGRVWADEPFKL